MTVAEKAAVGLKSALRALVTVAALVMSLDQAGYLNPDKLFTWKGILAVLVAILAKGGVSAATAKPVPSN